MKIHAPLSWQETLNEVLERRPRRLLILGGVDVGKSTLAHYLLQGLVEQGLRVALVDADVGQKEVGPPATVGLRHFEKVLPASCPWEAERLYFVGSTTPVGHLLPLVVGTKLLCDQAQADVTLINTTGLIRGPGLALKTYKIEALAPELIVALQRENELEAILSGFRHLAIKRLEVSPLSRTKNFAERKQRREEAYRQHFAQAHRVTLSLDKLVVQRRPRQWRRNLLCAVANQKRILALAILEEYDLAQGRVTLFTPANPYEIRILICGSLYVSRLGEELGKVRPRRATPPSGRPHTRPASSPPRETPARPRSPRLGRKLWKKRSLPGPKDRTAPEKGE